MTFKELTIGQMFIFKNRFPGEELGPWTKISARKYIKTANPFSLDPIERQKAQEYNGLECSVGSINTEVIPEK